MKSMTKEGKIISNGSQQFNVPNTEEGKAFLKALRKFSNPKRKNEFLVKGRGRRIEYARSMGSMYVIGKAQAGVTKQFAQWFAVYMESNPDGRRAWVSKLIAEKNRLEVEVKELKEKESPDKRDLILSNIALKEKIDNQAETIRDFQRNESAIVVNLKSVISQLNTDNNKLKSEKAYLQTVVNQRAIEHNKNLRNEIEGVTMTIIIPKGSKIKFVEE